MGFKSMVFIILAIALSACDPAADRKSAADEYLIGEKLRNVSSMANTNGQAQDHIAIYDKTVRRVHQFDLNKNVFERSFKVQNPTEEHFVLYDQNGNYIVDLSKKHLSIFDQNGNAQHGFLQFADEPISAAFRPDLGLFVMYGDKMTVGVVQVNSAGQVLKADVFGPSFGPSVVITAGDIDELGRLILGLSNGQIAIVDLVASLNAGSWVATTVGTALNNVVWVGPLRGSPHLVLVQQEDRMSLVNLTTGAVSDGPLINRRYVLYYGKAPDAHIIYEDPLDPRLVRMTNINGTAFQTSQLRFTAYAILNSRLDTTNNTWTLVSAKRAYRPYDGETVYTERTVNRYRFSDLLLRLEQSLADQASYELNSNRLFSLFPSKMGFAVNLDLSQNTQRDLRHFNIPFIQ